MEVREHGVDEPEAMAGSDEDAGFAECANWSRWLSASWAQCCQGGADDGGGALVKATMTKRSSFCAAARLRWAYGGFLRRLGVAFAVQVDDVYLRFANAERREGAEADVEGDFGDLDAAGSDCVEDSRGEVQAGGGGGDGAALGGEDGLVAVAIGRGVWHILGTLDVGRQGHVADAVQNGEEVGYGFEAQGAGAEVAAGQTPSASRAGVPVESSKTRRSPGRTLRPGRTRACQFPAASG